MTHETVLITGASGTVGRALRSHLARFQSIDVVPWPRDTHPLTDARQARQLLSQIKPTVVINLAVASDDSGQGSAAVNQDWPIHLAQWSHEWSYQLIHTSSVMVFADGTPGPLTLATKPTATTGYGAEKLAAERGVLATAPHSVVARLGWQIAPELGSNNMFAQLVNQQAAGGIKASSVWYPACSLVTDTVAALWQLRHGPGGIYQINGNQGLSYFDIVTLLNQHWADGGWLVERDDSFSGNQLMIDERVNLPKLVESLTRYQGGPAADLSAASITQSPVTSK